MVALPPNKTISQSQNQKLLHLVEELKFLESFEKDIVDKTRKTNDSYIIWKNIYEREYNMLFTFMNSVENICYSVLKQKGISFSHISGRVKTFESVYNKIFKRANDSSENERLKEKHGINYIDAIKEPHLHYNKVFDIIRDLAGVRIILLFESDLDDIITIFKKLNKDQDLKVKEIRFYKQCVEDADKNIPLPDKANLFNYRSLHLTVSPGKNRLNLIEYRNLSEMQCEIQFRSVLAHAWADVNHDLEYKHREVIKEVSRSVQDDLKTEFTKLSERLFRNDEFLNKIRKIGSNIKLD
jgi:ppGpp synthetase/RelA/SpoT-type nucleotidyltranferase